MHPKKMFSHFTTKARELLRHAHAAAQVGASRRTGSSAGAPLFLQARGAMGQCLETARRSRPQRPDDRRRAAPVRRRHWQLSRANEAHGSLGEATHSRRHTVVVCVCVCARVYVDVNPYVHAAVYVNVYVNGYVYVCMYMQMCMYMYMHKHVNMHIRIHAQMQIHV